MAQTPRVTTYVRRQTFEVGAGEGAGLIRVQVGSEGEDIVVTAIAGSGKSQTEASFTVPYDEWRRFAGALQVRPPRGKRKGGAG